MEESCQVKEVVEGVDFETQRRNCDLVWSRMVESTLRFGGNALAKGMNLVVDCEDKLENMDR